MNNTQTKGVHKHIIINHAETSIRMRNISGILDMTKVLIFAGFYKKVILEANQTPV